MGLQDLQRYIECHVPNACVPVDLLKIARGVTLRQPLTPAARLRPPAAVELCLVLDAERCLDRLYGGYFSDWVCGGQWSRMLQFLSVLIQTAKSNNMELAVFFNGALEMSRLRHWSAEQCAHRHDISQTLHHLAVKSTPPPKVWWHPPAALRAALRLALRQLHVQVVQSTREHQREVVAFCRQCRYHGVVGDCGEYVVLAPPRLFSAKQMKLTYKGSLETREYILAEMARGLDLQLNRMSLLAALLGNHLLPEHELADFHRQLVQQAAITKPSPEDIVRLVLQFVRQLPSVDNLSDVAARVFKSTDSEAATAGGRYQRRCRQLQLSVDYFTGDMSRTPPAHSCLSAKLPAFAGDDSCVKQSNDVTTATTAGDAAGGGAAGAAAGDGVSATGGAAGDGDGAAAVSSVCASPDGVSPALTHQLQALSVQGGAKDSSLTNGGSGAALDKNSDAEEGAAASDRPAPALPAVPAEVIRTAALRHQKGVMSPWVYQVLTQGEIKLEVSLEEETPKELPPAALFYRPVRQRVYAVLFNLYHHTFLSSGAGGSGQDREKSAASADHTRHQVREWVYTSCNQYERPHLVAARPLNWGVPTVQRLWFGKGDIEKKRRLRAFLSCLNSDTPLMQNPIYVPHHLLILASVLRYMMSQCGGGGGGCDLSAVTGAPTAAGGAAVAVLCKPELDAFIAQALSGKLADAGQLQQLQLSSVTPRGAQLASLFMQGVEHALFANDACGAPVPWVACCPWLFFDGKLFHSYLLKAGRCRNVTELCDDQMEMVAQLDLVRQAVLESLPVRYARPRPPPPLAAPPPMATARGGTGGGGGRLAVGGVVVGSWAGSRHSVRGGAPIPLMRTVGRGKPAYTQPASRKKRPGLPRVTSDTVSLGRGMTMESVETRAVHCDLQSRPSAPATSSATTAAASHSKAELFDYWSE